MIVVAAQANGKGIGRIRMRVIQHPPAASLHPFVRIASSPAAPCILPRVHLVVSLLKQWLAGTHQGAVSHEHLPYYLDEFTARQIAPRPITTCRGSLSQVHTQFHKYR